MPTTPTIPDRFAPAIQWCTQRVGKWQENRALLGLTEAGVDELDQQTQAARDARANYLRAKRELRNASKTYRASVGTMRRTASALLATIRATAKRSDAPASIYSAASVPPPAKRGPSPTPATPRDFEVELLGDGALKVRFECPHPPGVRAVTYRVERMLDMSGHWRIIQTAKGRSFTDDDIPAGSRSVLYRVTAQTSTRDGEPAVHLVPFGQGSMAAETGDAPKAERAA
jgi:hypothetical protein